MGIEVVKTVSTEAVEPVVTTTPAAPISSTLEELNKMMVEADWSKMSDVQSIMKFMMMMYQQKQEPLDAISNNKGKIKRVVIDYGE